MSDIAIRVENLSKQYQIGEAQPRYYSLREQIAGGVKRLLSSSRRDREARSIWALKDVSFDVKQGEVLGIIGRNGAGKSTLLKILSQITEPTEGRALIYGRVGSLLEVGTGFHPELTGRENVYMNGTILGMTKAEINRKFDEIVDFSGVEKFIDTPVKRYSSGMQVRLAFAVAAHLEPEILVVDEVLAVGDAEFQKKCLGKMDEVTQEGRTILFVSHDMGAIQRLAEYSLLLDEGKLIARGETKNIVDQYLTQTAVMLRNSGTLGEFHREKDTLGVSARLSGYRILDATGKPKAVFGFGEPFWVEIECTVQEFVSEVSFLLGIDTLYGQRIATVTSLEAGRVFSSGQGTVVVGRVQVENLLLKPGMYSLTLGLFAPKAGIDRVGNAAQIEVTNASEKHRHIEQVTVGYLQIPSPNWEIYVSKTERLP